MEVPEDVKRSLQKIESEYSSKLNVVLSKTQFSLSDNKDLLGVPPKRKVKVTGKLVANSFFALFEAARKYSASVQAAALLEFAFLRTRWLQRRPADIGLQLLLRIERRNQLARGVAFVTVEVMHRLILR